MRPDHTRALIAQTGETYQGLADRIAAVDPLLRVNRQTVYRWLGGNPPQSPNPHAIAAITAVWLDVGYPCTANGRPATLTTNSPASSYGLPVVVIDGVPHGSADVATLDLGDVPETIREAAIRAGYVVS